MTSRLATKDFESRLTKLTRPGMPWVMGTPLCVLYFNFGDEPFLGEIENSKFKLTNNSAFSPSGAIIEGSYSADALKANVIYEIKTMKFPYLWVRLIPLLGLVVFASIAFFNSDVFSLSMILGICVFFIFMFFLARLFEERSLRKLERRFNDELGLQE